MTPTATAPARLLLGAAVLVLLAVSAPGAPAAQQADGKDAVLALVNGRPITLGDVQKEIASLSLGDQIGVRGQIGRFTDSLITEEILFQSVLASDFSGVEDLRAKIKREVVEALIQRRVRSKINVTAAQVRAYYEQNRDLVRGLHVRPRQILLKERAQCEAAMARIGSEQDFAREARATSLHKDSAKEGGDMGWMMPVLGPDSVGFELELFQMALGEMRIFQSAAGCHLVRIGKIDDPPDPPPEQIEAFVRPILARRQEQKLLDALIEQASIGVRVERVYSPARQ